MKLLQSGLVVVYTVTIFVSAGLLFLSEFMIAKMLLPLFGGTSAVWTTCMVFFQAVLLLGYLYAHFSVKKLGLKYQPWLQVVLALAALAFLPFALPAWTGSGDAPVWNIFAALAIGIGVPFFILATTGPLLQYWFASTNNVHAKNPYFLYAASNLGSFMALAAYPFIIEPVIGLKMQSMLWAVGYGIYAVLSIVCAVLLFRFKSEAANQLTELKSAAQTTWVQRTYWVFLAAIPSSLMLGVTTYITTDVAAMPLLWMIPLAVYLLTFVAAFGTAKPKRIVSKITPLAASGVAATLILALLPNDLPRAFSAIIFLANFALISLVAHGRLSVLKPEPARLTEFYLWVAAGGVVGGLFNSLLAPLIFNDVYEFPLVLLLSLAVLVKAGTIRSLIKRETLLWVGVGTLLALAIFAITRNIDSVNEKLVSALIGGVAVFAFVSFKRNQRIFLAVMLPLLVIPVAQLAGANAIHKERTFYSVIKVKDIDHLRVIMHGITNHGGQPTDPKIAQEPVSYYHPLGPVGDIFTNCRKLTECRDVGIIGLGAGGLAAYGREGDAITFYEIDPAIKKIASDPKYFTYLKNSKAEVKTVIGDGRLRLAAERGNFDLFMVDAFSSDSIPTHLLTGEAIDLYMSKLRNNGLLALHISNRDLNLEPIVSAVARQKKIPALIRRDFPDESTRSNLRLSSVWVVLAQNPESLKQFNRTDWKPLQGGDMKPWSDDYSNILDALTL